MASIRDLADEVTRVYGKGDPSAIGDLYTDDAVLTVPVGRFEGTQQIVEYWAQLTRGFPNGTSEILRCAETDDMLFAEMVVTGTNTGELVLPDGTTVPPTGKATEIPAMAVVRVRDGRIAEQTVYYDQLGVLTQLGLVPG
jgi:steroid delta-isomerase-like uncharacterized protein